MTKKKKITIIALSVIGGIVLLGGTVAFIIFTGFWFLFPTSPKVRQIIYDEYSDDAKYVTISGTAKLHVLENSDYVFVELYPDDEFFQTHTNYRADYVPSYEVDSVNNEYLMNNGFYESLTEFELGNRGEKIYSLNGTVMLVVNESIWWDGDKPNLISIDINGTTYLDYETGKANLLYYVQNVMY